MELENIKIYRITHIDNIPHVIEFGITHKNSQNSNPGFVPIGDTSLIDTRSHRIVSVNNNEPAQYGIKSITLGGFIPFYFGIRMPMLYVIQNGGNFVEKSISPEDIIYLVCPILDVINLDNNYFFTDGHATDNFTTFFDHSKLDSLPNIINWDAIRAKYWGGHENLDTKRQKQAEFLTTRDVPFNCIKGFGCYNENAKAKLIEMGIDEESIKVIPQAYY